MFSQFLHLVPDRFCWDAEVCGGCAASSWISPELLPHLVRVERIVLNIASMDLPSGRWLPVFPVSEDGGLHLWTLHWCQGSLYCSQHTSICNDSSMFCRCTLLAMLTRYSARRKMYSTLAIISLQVYPEHLQLAKQCLTVLTVDWVICNMLAIRQGSIGHLRYVMKDTLQMLPLYGHYFYQHGCIYVKRNAFKQTKMEKALDYLSDPKIKVVGKMFSCKTRLFFHSFSHGQSFSRKERASIPWNTISSRNPWRQLAISASSSSRII